MVLVPEPTAEDALEIMKGLRPRYEEFHGVTITDEALQEAVDLSQRYISARQLPDKAIDLIDEAGSRVKLQIALPPREMREESMLTSSDRVCRSTASISSNACRNSPPDGRR